MRTRSTIKGRKIEANILWQGEGRKGKGKQSQRRMGQMPSAARFPSSLPQVKDLSCGLSSSQLHKENQQRPHRSLERLVLSGREALAKANNPSSTIVLRLGQGRTKIPFFASPTPWLQPKALFTQSSLAKDLFLFSLGCSWKRSTASLLVPFPQIPGQEKCPVPGLLTLRDASTLKNDPGSFCEVTVMPAYVGKEDWAGRGAVCLHFHLVYSACSYAHGFLRFSESISE